MDRLTLQRLLRRAPAHVALHFIDWLNSVFTVLKNCWFHRFLRNRINCVEIVAP